MKIGEANTEYEVRAQRVPQPRQVAEPVVHTLPEPARQKPAAPPSVKLLAEDSVSVPRVVRPPAA